MTAPPSDRLVERMSLAMRDLLAQPLPPGLYLVATPIGNLSDITLRALSVLTRADIVAAEDTRHSRKLLSNFGIAPPELAAYHEYNAEQMRPRLLSRISGGAAVALISDAGTPLVSDPGYKLVRAAIDGGLGVISIPGPSAALAVLTSSGLPTDTFLFAGFLPQKQGPRKARLGELREVPATIVFFEAPSRVAKALADMAAVLGPRHASVAKELTKLHERVTSGTLPELAEAFAGEASKGEFAIVVAPPSADQREASDEEIAAALREALTESSLRDAVRDVTDALQAQKGRVYAIGLKLREGT